jgi:hypothetical protein
MTRGMSWQVGRGAALPASEELRRQLLALLLAAVLVWYTLVVPAPAYAKSYGGATPDDEGVEGEVRGTGGAARAGRDDATTVDDLDWPEFIYPS